MPAAVIGGVIAGAGAIGAAAIGKSASNKAAQTAADASDRASNAAAQVQRETYAENKAALAPWQSGGLAANALINASLGIPTAAPAQAAPVQNALAQPAGLQPGGWYGGNLADAFTAGGSPVAGFVPSSPNLSGGALMNEYTNWVANGAQPMQQQAQPTTQAPAPQMNAMSQKEAADNAFNIFKNSTGYKFRVDQGMDALNSGYAGRGLIQSGAAMRAANDYGQGMASQEYGNWLNSLGNQQSLGFSAASAQAGVGQGFANSLGNIYQQNGANQANAALVKGQNNAMFANTVGTSIGNIAGSVFAPRPASVFNPSALMPSVAATHAANPSIF